MGDGSSMWRIRQYLQALRHPDLRRIAGVWRAVENPVDHRVSDKWLAGWMGEGQGFGSRDFPNEEILARMGCYWDRLATSILPFCVG